jgi:hypothetical protein
METRMGIRKKKARLAKPLIVIGWTFLGLALTLFVALVVLSDREQALTPGVGSFAVAMLFVFFGPPAVICGGLGLICLLIGSVFKRIG